MQSFKFWCVDLLECVLQVVSGKKTMYTACLLYADEDELMAQVITKLYKTAYKDTLFFLPQFDLKQGKYVLDSTARVIDERCDKKVIFLLSEYFYASDICQFAVNYAAAHGTGNGNLIPFHLTRNVSTVPNVLKGIAGIRWFRKGTRQHTWQILADCLLAEKVENELLLGEIKVTIEKMIAKDPEYYLQDPPYDDDIDPPGVPIEVIEPAGSSSMPTQEELEMQRIKIEKEMQRKKEKENKSKWKSLKQIKKAICEKILPQSVSSRYSGHQNSSSAKSSSPMATSSPAEGATSTESSTLTEMSPGNIKETSEKHSNVSGDKIPVSDGSEHGASGWRELNRTQNDLNANVDMETKHSEGFSDKFNICESDSKVFRAKTNNLMNKTRSTSATVSNIGDIYSADKPFEDSIYCNNIGDNKSNGKNIDLKPGCSYEMKEIKCKSDESENECLISKTDKVNDNTEEVKCHDTARSGEKETDSLMSSFNET